MTNHCHAHMQLSVKGSIYLQTAALNAQNQGKLASVCLQRFSSIFESTLQMCSVADYITNILGLGFHFIYFT